MFNGTVGWTCLSGVHRWSLYSAVLDRNGLRPIRFYLTTDDRVIMASEVGVLQVDPKIVKIKGRLQPGRMFLVDFEQGRLIPDDEIKETFSKQRPYAEMAQTPTNRIEGFDYRSSFTWL